MIWIIALATYDPNDPVWFFSTGLHGAPANFAGRVGAFLAELSFQLVGYAAYLIPAFLVVTGWHYFWCREIDAAGTKTTGGVLLFACTSAFLESPPRDDHGLRQTVSVGRLCRRLARRARCRNT